MFLKKKGSQIDQLLRSVNQDAFIEKAKTMNPKKILDDLNHYLNLIHEKTNKQSEVKELWMNTAKLIAVLSNQFPNYQIEIIKLLMDKDSTFIFKISKEINLHEIVCNKNEELVNLYINNPKYRKKIILLYNIGHFYDLFELFSKININLDDMGIVVSLTDWNMFDTEVVYDEEQFSIIIKYNTTMYPKSFNFFEKKFKNIRNQNNDIDLNTVGQFIINDLNENGITDFSYSTKMLNQNQDRYLYLIQKIPITSYNGVYNELNKLKRHIQFIENEYFDKMEA